MVKKLVLPLAGRGKRLMPLTRTTPKNLVEVDGQPLVEYALVEAVRSGITEAILIVSPDHQPQFEEYLRTARVKFPRLSFRLELQERPFGHGHAILQVADRIEGEPFAVRFPDDILLNGTTPTLKHLVDHYETHRTTTVLLQRVPKAEVSRYGVVAADLFSEGDRLHAVRSIVEKPAIEDAPSDLVIFGAYVVAPTVLENLKELFRAMPEKDDALLLGDGILLDLKKDRTVLGWEFQGMRLDCGTLENLKRAREFFKTHDLPFRKKEKVSGGSE